MFGPIPARQLLGSQRLYRERIHDPHDDRDNTAVRQIEHSARAVPFPVDQHRVSNASMGDIQRNKVPHHRVAGQEQGLDNQQPPILVVGVTDGGNDGSSDFT